MSRRSLALRGNRFLLGVNLGLWVLLGTSGLYVWASRPSGLASYSDMETLGSEVTLYSVIRDAHGVMAWIAVATSVALVINYRNDDRRRELVVSVVAVGTVGLAVLTGLWASWDDLALVDDVVGPLGRGVLLERDDDSLGTIWRFAHRPVLQVVWLAALVLLVRKGSLSESA